MKYWGVPEKPKLLNHKKIKWRINFLSYYATKIEARKKQSLINYQ